MDYVVVILVFAVLLSFAYSVARGIGWLPTRSRDVERFLNNAGIMPGDKFYDLGCGDGRLLLAAARRGATAIGYEVSLIPFVLAYLRKMFSPYGKQVHIVFKDFWFADLSDAKVVYFFLIPRIYPKLKKKLQAELKPGAKLIAYVWPFADWQPDKVDFVEKENKIYTYIIK